MKPHPTFPLDIFYDGSCHVCASEMASYQRKNSQDRLNFIDISAEDFNPESYGKSCEEFMKQLHARDSEGNWYTAVDAFLALWQAFPPPSPYRVLGSFLALPGINQLAGVGYRLFARYRGYLPKKSKSCPGEDNSCNVGHPR